MEGDDEMLSAHCNRRSGFRAAACSVNGLGARSISLGKAVHPMQLYPAQDGGASAGQGAGR
jgi:hypothetical protein